MNDDLRRAIALAKISVSDWKEAQTRAMKSIRKAISIWMKTYKTPRTGFGRMAMADPFLLDRLDKGTILHPDSATRILDAMGKEHERAAARD